MGKKYKIIDHNGEKWLYSKAIAYIGSKPAGSTVDESEVKEVVQYRQKDNENADWKIWTTGVIDWDCVIETRAAYTDAEPPDIDYEKEMPHKKWPSTKYVARPADAESHELSAFDEILNNTSDDAKMNVSLQMDLNYWKRRCEAAEKYINESPCDPDITKAQNAAYDAWQEIVKQQPK